MELLDHILSSRLQPLMKRYPAGEYLFRQGDPATTMYFLISGRLELINERPEGPFLEAVLEMGQFLGEKVLFREESYPRAFSGRAETELLVMELTRRDVEDIEDADTSAAGDLLRTMLQVVGQRFEQLSFLAQCLRTSNEVARVAQVTRYFARVAGSDGENRKPFPLSEEVIRKYVDTDRKTIRFAIKSLLDEGILGKSEGLFVLNDEESLLQFAEQAEKAE